MKVVLGACVFLFFGSCGGVEEPPQETSEQPQIESQQEPEPAQEGSPLAKVCDRAFDLIDNNEPGSVPRKKAVVLANEAFFIDDSVPVTEAFSNLNNVYVFDDGSSSEEEVRSQLEQVCP